MLALPPSETHSSDEESTEELYVTTEIDEMSGESKPRVYTSLQKSNNL